MTEHSKTAAATRTRMRRSEEKMADHLASRGWFCRRTGLAGANFDPTNVQPHLQVYATNGLGETFRVVGWNDGGEPILLGGDEGTRVGFFDYIYTIGVK